MATLASSFVSGQERRRGRMRTARRLGIIGILAAVLSVVLLAPAASAAPAPGTLLWHDSWHQTGVTQDEWANAVAVDAAGHPIVVGNAAMVSGDSDIRYVSYQANSSTLRWNSVPTTWDGGTGGDDWAVGTVVDNAHGWVYVAGTTDGPNGYDCVLLKLDNSDGSLIWARTYDGPPSNDDEAAAVAKDKYGNVYVTGDSQRADGTWDIVTVKYRPDGSRAWVRRHDNGGSRHDFSYAIGARGSYLYVVGTSERPGRAQDVVMIKYSLGGAKKWLRYYDDALHRSDRPQAMALTSGSIYVCGAGKKNATHASKALLMKYRLKDGKRIWVKYASSGGGKDNEWYDVAVDNKGRVHVTGCLNRKASGDDIVTRLCNKYGKKLWQRTYTTAGNKMDYALALAVDGARRTYVAGMRTGAADIDIVVIGYAASGKTLWYTKFPAPADNKGDDWAFDIALSSTAAFVVGDLMINPPDDGNFLTLSIKR